MTAAARAAAPSSPAASPIAASSPSTVVNSRGLVQPRQASTPSSRRRPRIAADAELATNSTHTTRISANSTRLSLSIAVKIANATPFFTQFSDSVSGGWPNFPAGSSIVVGDGDDPATMSTSRCGAHLDLLRHLPDPLQRHRIRPGHPRYPNPHHADRIVSRQIRAVVACVLQGRQRGQRRDQVDRLAYVSAQILIRQQVAAVQRPACCRVRRGGDYRLIRTERYARQRVEFVDLRRVEDADELRAGGEAGEGRW